MYKYLNFPHSIFEIFLSSSLHTHLHRPHRFSNILFNSSNLLRLPLPHLQLQTNVRHLQLLKKRPESIPPVIPNLQISRRPFLRFLRHLDQSSQFLQHFNSTSLHRPKMLNNKHQLCNIFNLSSIPHRRQKQQR